MKRYTRQSPNAAPVEKLVSSLRAYTNELPAQWHQSATDLLDCGDFFVEPGKGSLYIGTRADDSNTATVIVYGEMTPEHVKRAVEDVLSRWPFEKITVTVEHANSYFTEAGFRATRLIDTGGIPTIALEFVREDVGEPVDGISRLQHRRRAPEVCVRLWRWIRLRR